MAVLTESAQGFILTQPHTMAGSAITFSLRKIMTYPLVQKCSNCSRRLFGRHLLLTNIGVSASFSFTGDFLVQQYEMSQSRKTQLDKLRSTQVTVSGAVIGVLCHYWYIFLDARFPGRTLRSIITKVAVDQAVCSPLYISCFIATTCFLENKSMEQFRSELAQKGWTLYVADCAVWPPAQIINFYLLPLRFRVLFDNTVSLAFDVYTSYVKYEIPLNNE